MGNKAVGNLVDFEESTKEVVPDFHFQDNIDWKRSSRLIDIEGSLSENSLWSSSSFFSSSSVLSSSGGSSSEELVDSDEDSGYFLWFFFFLEEVVHHLKVPNNHTIHQQKRLP